MENTKYWILMKIFVNKCKEFQIPNYIYVKKNEKILQSVNKQMIGHEGVLTYINRTSRGQSGGPVMRRLFDKDQKEMKEFVGIHVSGYLQRSKCTLLVDSNLNWIQTVMTSSDVEDLISMESRIKNFIENFVHCENDLFILKDMEIFPITSKLVGYFSKCTNVNKIRIELQLKKLGDDEVEIMNRIQCIPYIFVKESNIDVMDISSINNSEF